MAFKEHGADKYGRFIQQNVEQAQYLKTLIEANADLELLVPVSLNVICFRFRNPRLDEDQTNALNQEIVIQLQEAGIAVPSSTSLVDKYASAWQPAADEQILTC
jgi:aromatic-L-amino-acid/L-tryptophan decarboxylase